MAIAPFDQDNEVARIAISIEMHGFYSQAFLCNTERDEWGINDERISDNCDVQNRRRDRVRFSR
jgi:hypothetical protein